jgi:hypothetical protein
MLIYHLCMTFYVSYWSQVHTRYFHKKKKEKKKYTQDIYIYIYFLLKHTRYICIYISSVHVYVYVNVAPPKVKSWLHQLPCIKTNHLK